MTDVLEKANEWLAGMNRAFRARTVTYVRGETSAEITATVGKTVFRVDKGYGLFEHVESRDYLIAVEDFSAFAEPERGDQVKDVLNGKTEIFEVMAPGDEPHFRWSDPYRKALRIHTKHVGTQT